MPIGSQSYAYWPPIGMHYRTGRPPIGMHSHRSQLPPLPLDESTHLRHVAILEQRGERLQRRPRTEAEGVLREHLAPRCRRRRRAPTLCHPAARLSACCKPVN